MNFVIIGAGPAGVRAAETLRENDPQATITLVGGEPGEPYARMAIPYILNGAIDDGGARQRRAPHHLEALGIRYLHGKARTVHTGPDGGQVDLDDGTQLPYDRLLVATGSSPSLPPIPGTDVPGAVTCWTLEDARQIAAKLKPGARVVMLGAGFRGWGVYEVAGQQRCQTVGCGRALGADFAFHDDSVGQQHAAALAGGAWRGGHYHRTHPGH
jgi:NADPH-dependent 2,4-dienoyl-CoA reductase/sulfur reductase-like enzyme